MKLVQGVLATFTSTLLFVQAVTPVEKVTQLLKQLSADLEKEGAAEAAQYDKYSCFCKEQASDKLYAIEKSDERIKMLTAKIESLESDLATLAADIKDLADKIEKNEKKIADATKVRQDENAEYVVNEANISGAISACDRALEALKESKAAFQGDANMDEALTQLSAIAERTLGKQTPDVAKAYTSGYHSNDIIAVIADLRVRFIKVKNDFDAAEFESNSMFEKKRLGLQDENQFALEAKTDKEAVHAAKTEEKSGTEADKLAETNARNADQEFMDVLTDDCQKKADLFDQRSKVRSGEITAIGEAMEALTTKVETNWGANKKLADLQTSKSAGHWAWINDDAPVQAPVGRHGPTSLLQLGRGRGSDGVRKMLAFLTGAASRLKSPALSALALKVRVSEDHFVKVRQIIKDLVAKLEADKKAEATRKGYCDKNMASSMAQRDTAADELEQHAAKLSALAAEEASLTADIAQLQKEIAANAKALKEATELRQDEKATNEKTISDATEGKAGVEVALQVLTDFYSAQGFLQYVPPKSDRDGNTVADVRPEIFDSEYKGKQAESKGVIGLLQIILSDFDRTITTVTDQEAASQAEFEDFKDKTEKDTAAKEAEVTTKEARVVEVQDDIVSTTDEQTASAESHTNALDSLETLKKMCVDGEESYAERVAARVKEIEALKQAQNILNEWQA